MSCSFTRWSRPRVGSSRRSTGRRAGELHRQHQPEPLSLGQVARVVVARQPGHDAIGERPARAGRGARSRGRPARTPRPPWPGTAGRPASGARGRSGERGAAGGSAPSTRDRARLHAGRPGAAPTAARTCPSRCAPSPRRPRRGAPRGRRRAGRRRRRSARPARARRAPPPGSRGAASTKTVTRRRRNQGVEAIAEAGGLAAGVAHRERHGVPAGQPTELHDRRGER